MGVKVAPARAAKQSLFYAAKKKNQLLWEKAGFGAGGPCWVRTSDQLIMSRLNTPFWGYAYLYSFLIIPLYFRYLKEYLLALFIAVMR